MYICAGDDSTGSLLHSQGGKMLFHFLDVADLYAERRKERTNVRLSHSRILLFYSNWRKPNEIEFFLGVSEMPTAFSVSLKS